MSEPTDSTRYTTLIGGAANLKLNHRISAESPFSGDDTDSAWAKQLLADYVALGEGCDEWLIILCAQDDRAYPAPLDYRTLPIENDPVPPFRNSLGRVTISLNRKRGGFLMKNIRLPGSLPTHRTRRRGVGAHRPRTQAIQRPGGAGE